MKKCICLFFIITSLIECQKVVLKKNNTDVALNYYFSLENKFKKRVFVSFEPKDSIINISYYNGLKDADEIKTIIHSTQNNIDRYQNIIKEHINTQEYLRNDNVVNKEGYILNLGVFNEDAESMVFENRNILNIKKEISPKFHKMLLNLSKVNNGIEKTMYENIQK